MNLIVIGPAGSGKSALVSSFSQFLKEEGYDTKAVNLDPASPPVYDAFKDVREFVKTEEVMVKEGLGINGALIRSMDMSLNYIDELIVKSDFTIYDTPGQMELFVYLNSGIEIAKKIGKSDASVCIFVVDTAVASTPENYVSILAQNAVVSLRLDMPTLTVFNKVDVRKVPTIEEVRSKIREGGGVLSELMEGLLDFMNVTTARYRTVAVSAKSGEGLDDLLCAVNEVFCSCGDLS